MDLNRLYALQALLSRHLPDWRALRLTPLGSDSWRLSGLSEGKARCLTLIARGDGSWRLLEAGRVTALHSPTQGADPERLARPAGGLAPMDGVLRQLMVSPGDKISAGQVLYVLEAMKMQLQVSAPRAGRIAGVHSEAGARVRKGEILLSFEEVT